MALVLYGLIAGLFSLVGGFAVIFGSKIVLRFITPLLAFAAGTFLAVSFLDLLPEAVEAVAEPHPIFIAAVVGFCLFFILERLLMKYVHLHPAEELEHRAHTESLPVLVLLGDTVHNFLDGILIAFSYLANPSLGLTATFAVAAHEVPQEIGDFAIMLDSGWSKAKIVAANVLSSLMTLGGVGVGYGLGTMFEARMPYLLAGVAGIFIYIAASDLIPEIHHRSGHQRFYGIVAAFLLGVIVVGYLITFTHAS